MMAEREDGSGGQGDEGEPDTLNRWQRGSEKHPTLASNSAICDGATINYGLH